MVVAETYVRFESSTDADAFDRMASDLEAFTRIALTQYFSERERTVKFAVVVRIETGSSRVWITIKAAVGVIVLYGSIRQSADYLTSDARTIGGMLIPHVGTTLGIGEQPTRKE